MTRSMDGILSQKTFVVKEEKLAYILLNPMQWTLFVHLPIRQGRFSPVSKNVCHAAHGTTFIESMVISKEKSW